MFAATPTPPLKPQSPVRAERRVPLLRLLAGAGLCLGLAGCAPETGEGQGEIGRTGEVARSLSDVSPPTIGRVGLVSGEAWSNRQTMTIAVEAQDNIGVSSVCVSETAVVASGCTAWQAFSGTANHTASVASGAVNLRVFVKDAAGNASAGMSLASGVDTRGPSGGSATATGIPGGVRLSWSGVTDAESGVAGYRVMARPGTAAPYCSTGTPVWTGTTLTADLTGLTSGTWAFRVCPRDRAGNGNSGMVVTGASLRESDPPVTSSFVLAGGVGVSGVRDVAVAVGASDVSAITRMCMSETSSSCTAWGAYRPSTTFRLSGGSGPKTVYLWLQDAHGNRSASPTSASLTFDWDRPENGEVEAVAGDALADLSWTGFADAHTAIVGYEVVYGLDTAPADCASGTSAGRTSGTSLRVSGLTETTRYGFRVCAVDEAGNVSTGATTRVTLLEEYAAPVVDNLLLDGGAATTSAGSVAVSLSAHDASTITEMCLSWTATCGTWRSYSTSLSSSLPAGTGVHTLSVWLRDEHGNTMSVPATASIERGVDADGDGVIARLDCDDADEDAFPGAPEVCDGDDEDCDGVVDEAGAAGGSTYYRDVDGDGFGSSTTTATACSAPTGYVNVAGDCNDGSASVRPGGAEVCGGADEDCDGRTDELPTCRCDEVPYEDKVLYLCDDLADWDTAADACAEAGLSLVNVNGRVEGEDLAAAWQDIGYAGESWIGASAPTGDDWEWEGGADWLWSPAIAPAGEAGARCAALDADGEWSIGGCGTDLAYACEDGSLLSFAEDGDGDGVGAVGSTGLATSTPDGWSTVATDCVDTDTRIRPGREETCDGVDEDCDGTIDEACGTVVSIPWFGVGPLSEEPSDPGICARFAKVTGPDPHNYAYHAQYMTALDGGTGHYAAVEEARNSLDYSCWGNFVAPYASPGNYPDTETWPITTLPSGGQGAARFRGWLRVDADHLNATMGIMGNDSARLVVGGMEIAWVSWGSGQWKKFRWVRFPAPGLYPIEVSWTTNQGYDIDPLEVVWGPGFLSGYSVYDTMCMHSSCSHPIKYTPIPGLVILDEAVLSQAADGDGGACRQCASSASCPSGTSCSAAGICE